MKHYLNVCDIDGSKVEPVDIVTFGSPCQDLSVAGKRAGLKHEVNGDDETTRSGLFMEAVRIIKEMRAADEKRNRESGRTDEPVRPRFALWENVPGAFSSNKGQDFRVVLEELARIADETVSIPMPQKGKWTNAGEIHSDGWSIAWRTLDAQHTGVPQRRRRIFLVADFGGECAGEVLFECQSLRGNPPQSREERQTAPGDAQNRIAPDDREGAVPYTLKIRSGVEVDSNGRAAGKGALIQKDKSATLGVSQDQYLFQPVASGFPLGFRPENVRCYEETATTICNGTRPGFCNGVIQSVVALEPGIAAREGGHIYEDVAGTLRAKPGDNMQAVAYGISSYDSNAMKSSNPHSGVYEADTSRTLDLNGGNPACNQGGIAVVEAQTVDFGRTADRIYINPKTSVTLSAQGGGMGAKTGLYCVPEGVGFKADDGSTGGVAPTLVGDHNNRVTDHSVLIVEPAAYAVDMGGGKSSCMIHDNQSPTLTCTHYGAPAVAYGDTYQKTTGPLMANSHPGSYSGQDAYTDMFVVGKEKCVGINGDVAGTLDASYYKGCGERQGTEREVVCIDRAFFNQGQNAQYEPQCYTDGTVPTLVARGPSAVATYVDTTHADDVVRCDDKVAPLQARDYKGGKLVAAVDCRNATEDESTNGTLQSTACHNTNSNNVVRVRYIVRRLTPTECARLQGFPDKWGHYPEKDILTDEEYRFWVKVQQTHAIINSKKPWKDDVKADTVLKWYNGLHTDSAEYKMWGNGIALPCARIPLRGIAQLGAKTLASLFDGSGGFPLAGRLEGIEPRWSSEVEPYPIAVTVHQFGGLG